VGLRKVVGSGRGGLVLQFLTESVVFSALSFVLGLLLAQGLLPYFNTLADRPLTMPWSAWWLAPSMALAALVIGVFAGIYPAFYLSSFRPVQVLKGSVSQGSRNSLLRNSLVVFQFAASVVLIIGTIVIYRQMHFILNRDVGFDKEQVLLVQGANTLPEQQLRAFKTELSKLAAVKSATISDFLPVEGFKRNGQSFYNEGHRASDPSLEAQVFHVDEDYIQTMGIKLAAGRNFSKTMATDRNAVLINETMAKQLHLGDPVGRKIIQYTGDTYTVIGVVRDFNYNSMRSDIGPLVIRLDLSPSIVSARIDGARAAETIKAITALWKNFSPGQPIRYTFLDEQFAAMYSDVLRMGRMFTGFAALAVIIACLGLFGLSAFMAEQRSKEIGIRKVLGATVSGITGLLSYDFVKLVVLAIVIAVPVGGWAMHQWLQNYAYQTTLDWWIFVAAGVFAIGVALCTVSFQSIKAARANPAETLKRE
jgi:putative ABC transport system permease protein